MIEKIKNMKLKNNLYRNIYSLFIGFLTYLYIFGNNFLFSNTSFFYTKDHPMFHAGYLSYINDGWNFPLTVTNNLFPGSNFSIIFMDSIPIYSLFLKIIYSTFGVKVFNPFPIWYLICFMLFAFYAGKILSIKVKNNYIFGISLILLVNTPLMINRMVWHSALAAHWLILVSIYYYIINKENDFKSLGIFAFFTGFSIFIHPYIFTMITSIYIIVLSLAFLRKKYKEAISSIGLFAFLLVIYFLIFLSADNGSVYPGTDYNKYGAEFNSFFCGDFPIDLINDVLWCYPPYTTFGHEGYAYLGLGFIFLLSLLVFQPKKIYFSIKTNYLLSLGLFLMVIYSFGNKWKIAHYQFFEFQPLSFHKELLELFRATGRYTWPVCYFLMVFLIFNVASLKRKYLAYLLLTFSLIFQVTDMNNIYASKSELFQVNTSTEVQSLMAKNIYMEHPEQTLYLLPDETCAWGEIDHYIVALYYLNQGGSIHSTRTARLKINTASCKGYKVKNDIEEKNPFHFLLNDIALIEGTEIKNQYSCIPIESFVESNRRPVYCEKNS